jgi:hypothetical protein
MMRSKETLSGRKSANFTNVAKQRKSVFGMSINKSLRKSRKNQVKMLLISGKMQLKWLTNLPN